jgi:hypothetical protein
MKRTIGLLAILCFYAWRGASAQKVQDAGLVHELGPEWKSMYEISRDLQYDAIELVRNGDTLADWREVVGMEATLEPSKLSPEDTLNKWAERMEKKCPGAMKSKVISRDQTSVLFEWHRDACGKLPEESDVGRILLGSHSWYVLNYGARVPALAPDVREQWLKTFADATFDDVTNSFDTAWMSVDVDTVIPVSLDRVISAIKPAMASQDCKVSSESAGRVECKRPRGRTSAEHSGAGGESVTAVLEAQGDKTHVVITTGLGFSGRLAKRNYSTSIYQAMIKELHKG